MGQKLPPTNKPPPTGNSRKTRERVKTSITREKEISKEGEKQHKPMSSKGIKPHTKGWL
ncbi:hypothetical protein J5U21_00262 [Saccharolobus shibatae]|uniref:Uncharacterized protein n=1 Tax=Saccharolobus shibatae TaxID=2286 RepID=A0A8F5GV81_9CREN|nr:hypothetical protein J5U21_00262 [Saccharolobus shibatae]